MILNCGVFVQWRPCLRANTVCLASPSATAEQLRRQLDNLHKEADSTRAKASNARLRLMRLSEAVEKLRRQAAISVQTGKENDARDMLFQKKKVMQAMEKLKTRIELFDELSAKLNEAISIKENLLLGNMALDLDITEAEAPSNVRIVSPTDESPSNSNDNHDSNPNDPLESDEAQTLPDSTDSRINFLGENEVTSNESSSSSTENSSHSLHEISTYEDFLENLDQQLDKIEQELKTFLRFSNLLLDNKEKPEYSKVQHTTQLLEDVHRARDRIANVKLTRLNSNHAQL